MSLASQPVRFRPFAATDADLLAAWLAAVGLGVPPGVATHTWADRLIAEPNISCWAVTDHENDREVLGFFRLDTGPDQQAEMTLIVAPDHRRRGLGMQILEEALSQARSRGIRRILAVVRESNTAAQAFFDHVGFAENECNTPGHIHLHRLVHRADRQPPLEI